MGLPALVKRAVASALDLLFPPRCAFCDGLTDTPRDTLCGACSANLLKPGEFDTRNTYFDRVAAAFAYEGAARDAVLRFKFRGERGLAEPMGALLAQVVSSAGMTADLMTWTPLGAERLAQRGYNQSELLARALSDKLGIPAQETLRRTRETMANSSLGGADARMANVEGAFAVIDGSAVGGKRVMLVDDVITTGATLGECARELRLGGADCVVCAVFARTEE